MQAIYPISALQKDSAAVRRDASEDIVRLTVDGRGAYVFATEEVLEDYVQHQIDEALYEYELMKTLDRSVADERAGRLTPSQEGVERVRELRAERKKSIRHADETNEGKTEIYRAAS